MLTVKCKCSRGSVATAWLMTPSVSEITGNPIHLRAGPAMAAVVETPKAILVVGSRMMLLLRWHVSAFTNQTQDGASRSRDFRKDRRTDNAHASLGRLG